MSFHQDLLAMTRDMHLKSFEVEYMKKTPLLNLILEKKNVKFSGGKYYYFEADTADKESLTQDYEVNEPLTHGDTDTVYTVKFGRKKFQHAMTLDVDEDLENGENAADGTQLQDLAKHKVKKAQEAVRLHLRKLFYAGWNNSGTANAFLGTDSNKYVQGLNSALGLNATAVPTYGGIARSESQNSTYAWFQPAADGYTKTTQETAVAISIDQLQQWADPLVDMETSPMDLVCIVGNTLYLALKAEAQARSMPVKYDPAGNFKFGIEEMVIDNIRIVKDPFLQSKYNTLMGMNTGYAHALERRLYILNMNDIHFMVHPKRYFDLTEFFDQAKIAGAADFKLARIRFAGNLCLWHPNQHLYMANVTT